MVASSELAIIISGKDEASKIIDGVAKSFGNVGKAASAPLKALGSLGGALGDVAKLGAGFATGGLIAQAPGALLDMAKSAAADEQATARLSQTLRNLPGDFEKMTDQVNLAIGAGQKLAFSDDDIRDSFQFLATATGDSSEALKRQKTALDLARGANIPLAQASKLVGKVNAENVDTFKKLGINIKDGATEAEALAAVQKKFAGQAQAYADSTAGQFEQAQIAVAEIQESIGSALLPVMAKIGSVLVANLPAIQEFVAVMTGSIGDIVTGLGELFSLDGAEWTDSLQRGLEGVFGEGSPIVGMALDFFYAIRDAIQPLLDVLPDLGTAINQAFGFFTTGGGDIETFRGVLNKLIGPQGAQGVIEVFTNLVGFFRGSVIPLWQGLAAAAQKALGGDLQGALQDAAAALGNYGREIVTSLATWARRFIEWVAPFISPMLVELGKMLAQLGAWILTVALPAIVTQLAEWAKAFVIWVAPLIPPLLLELGKLLLALGGWILTTALPAIVKQLGEWGNAFLSWVAAEVLPKLPGELEKIRVALVGFLAEAGAAVWSSIAGDQPDSVKSKLLSALKSAIDAAVAGVKSWIDDLIAPFRRAWDTIKNLLDKIRGGRGEVDAGVGVGGGGGLTARATAATLGLNGALRPVTLTNYIEIDARTQNPQLVAQAWGMTLGEAMRTQLISGAR